MKSIEFPTDLASIEQRIQELNPALYSANRNYKEGAISYLSPYISRGVISTRQVLEQLKERNLPWTDIEKFVQELAWRDHWQLIYRDNPNGIFSDLKHEQFPVQHHQIPAAIVKAQTGITAVDEAIQSFYQTGYLHNHMRMYIASICCNIGQAHWLKPAHWMYAHLLDGDLASNHLSWQWVAGTNSNKKYFANQDNINTFFQSDQKGTFLDLPYDAFSGSAIPAILLKHENFPIQTDLPMVSETDVLENKKTLIYNYYNLDPYWHSQEDFQRIVVLEPSFFEKYPVSQKCIDFVLQLAKNIPNLKIYVGEYAQLMDSIAKENLIFKEHPTNNHYQGTEEPRTWLCKEESASSSFFKFWKKCKKELEG